MKIRASPSHGSTLPRSRLTSSVGRTQCQPGALMSASGFLASGRPNQGRKEINIQPLEQRDMRNHLCTRAHASPGNILSAARQVPFRPDGHIECALPGWPPVQGLAGSC